MPASRAAWTTAGLSAFMTPMLTTGILSPVRPSVRTMGLGDWASPARLVPWQAWIVEAPPTAASPASPDLMKARLLSSLALSVTLSSCIRIVPLDRLAGRAARRAAGEEAILARPDGMSTARRQAGRRRLTFGGPGLYFVTP